MIAPISMFSFLSGFKAAGIENSTFFPIMPLPPCVKFLKTTAISPFLNSSLSSGFFKVLFIQILIHQFLKLCK